MSLSVVDCTTNLVIPASPFGQVRGGILTLYGYAKSHSLSQLLDLRNDICRMDIGYNAYRDARSMDCLVLHLGQSLQKYAIGLILEPLTNGHFIRIGQFAIKREEKVTIWPSHLEPVVIVVE
jgi:hypothetical protein